MQEHHPEEEGEAGHHPSVEVAEPEGQLPEAEAEVEEAQKVPRYRALVVAVEELTVPSWSPSMALAAVVEVVQSGYR